MGRPKVNPDFVEKTCPVCLKPFNCKWQKRETQRYCSKICSNADPETKKKIVEAQAKTFKEKYGCHPMQTKETQANLRASMLEKHGVDWGSKMVGYDAKVKKTKLERYGDETYNNQEKMKLTCLENFGVDNFRKSPEYQIKHTATTLKKYGVEHASKSTQYKDSHKKLMFEKFLTSPRFENFEALFSFSEYQGVTEKFNKKYKFKCKRCQKVNECDISDGRTPKCQDCDNTGCSDFQYEVTQFVKTLCPNDAVVENDRTLIRPLEVDIFIPSRNFGIECDGLYYHSEVSGTKNKNYHLNKTKACAANGVRLIHLFENEWHNKKEIVKSILSSILSNTNEKIYGRDCIVKEIDSDIKSAFLEKNHIQGSDHATIKLGLFYGDSLKSVMTFVKSRFDRKVEWEMSRYCSELGNTVIGGGSKLFSYFIKNYNPKSVVSYSDRRYFSGEVYLKLGFTFSSNSPPAYHYIIDSSYYALESRINWQKAKLEKKLLSFDPSLTEWENMKANGFDRIWDCGHSKWIWIDKPDKSVKMGQ